MKIARIASIVLAAPVVLLTAAASASASGAGMAFTYQGLLTASGTAFTGSCNFQFSLWDSATNGSQIGSTSPPRRHSFPIWAGGARSPKGPVGSPRFAPVPRCARGGH